MPKLVSLRYRSRSWWEMFGGDDFDSEVRREAATAACQELGKRNRTRVPVFSRYTLSFSGARALRPAPTLSAIKRKVELHSSATTTQYAQQSPVPHDLSGVLSKFSSRIQVCVRHP